MLLFLFSSNSNHFTWLKCLWIPLNQHLLFMHYQSPQKLPCFNSIIDNATHTHAHPLNLLWQLTILYKNGKIQHKSHCIEITMFPCTYYLISKKNETSINIFTYKIFWTEALYTFTLMYTHLFHPHSGFYTIVNTSLRF